METSGKWGGHPGRYGILANFQFCVDEGAKEICEGITLSISNHGFSFLTESEVRQGQTITVIKHSLPGFYCPKATVVWVTRGIRCIEAGAEFHSDN